MTPDEWQELIEEAPGGPNSGRRRGAGGDWLDLSPVYDEVKGLGFDYMIYTETHGLRSTYQAGCRCASCKRANREYHRALRNRAVRPQDGS